jgi:short-subunit dehydrogenase
VSAVLSGRDPSLLAEVAREAEKAGRDAGKGVRMVPLAGDLTDESYRQELVKKTERELGRLDVLLNNAGRGYYARTRDVDLGELEALFALNVLAPLRLTQLALPALAAASSPAGKSTVVMVSSIAGVLAAPTMGAYAASKFALEAVAMALRSEVAGEGVQVLVVRPGPVATPFRAHAVATGLDARVRPRGSRPQAPEEVAEQIWRAVDAGHPVLETSLFVRIASFGARAVPGLVRRVTARMAARGST